MADTALRDLLPKLELLDQVPRLTQRKHLVDHATCQDPAYIFHGGQTDSISEGRHMIKAPQIENESNCRDSSNKIQTEQENSKPELSGFCSRLLNLYRPLSLPRALDSMSDMIRKGELTVKHNSRAPPTEPYSHSSLTKGLHQIVWGKMKTITPKTKPPNTQTKPTNHQQPTQHHNHTTHNNKKQNQTTKHPHKNPPHNHPKTHKPNQKTHTKFMVKGIKCL
ncbi:hypothetical protein J6590_024662 [Homalodisca vitripennis]|nr:hypothetical protein J6590_024662 [Homalodisca vitripennis]